MRGISLILKAGWLITLQNNVVDMQMTVPASINKFLLIRNVGIFLILGNLLYHLFPFPPVVWRLLFVLLAVYNVVLSIKKGRLLQVERFVLFFCVLNLVYFFVSYLWITPSTTQIGNTLYVTLAFVMFIFWGERGLLTERFFMIAACLLVFCGSVYFYHAQMLALQNTWNEDITVNASTIFLVLLPMMFLLKNRWLSMVLFCICWFFLLNGAKRGNIIAAVLPTCMYVYYILKNEKKSLGQVLLILIILIIAGNWLVNQALDNDYLLGRFEDMQEGNSSNRDVIYLKSWNVWYDAGRILTYLFGYGFDGTIATMGARAHNDWLELLVDNGLVGIVVYLCVFVSFYQIVRRIKSQEYKFVVLAVLFIWLAKTVYSMGYTDQLLAILFLPVGYVFGMYKRMCAR